MGVGASPHPMASFSVLRPAYILQLTALVNDIKAIAHADYSCTKREFGKFYEECTKSSAHGCRNGGKGGLAPLDFEVLSKKRLFS